VVRVHGFPLDHCWTQPLEFVYEHAGEGEAIFADVRFLERLPELLSYGKITPERLQEGINWVIFHKGYATVMELTVLVELKREYEAVFANEVFVVFTNKACQEIKSDFDPVHLQALWIKVDARQSITDDKKTSPRREVLVRLNSFWLSLRKCFLILGLC